MILGKLKGLLKNGLKIGIKLDVFGEKKYNKVHPKEIKRTSWTEDIIRRRQK